MFKKIKNFFISKGFKIFLISLGSFIVVFLIAFIAYSAFYQNKIYPGVKIGKIDFSGLNQAQAMQKLENASSRASNQDVVFEYGNQTWNISENDLKLKYNITQTIDVVFSIGRRGSIWQKIEEKSMVLISGKKLLASFDFDKNVLDRAMADISNKFNTPTTDASLYLDNGQVAIREQQSGREVDITDLEANFKQKIGFLDDRKITINVADNYPKIYSDQLTALNSQVQKIINQSILLKSENKEFTIEQSQVFSWINIVAEPAKTGVFSFIKKAVAAEKNGFTPKILFNSETIKSDIEKISSEINKDPKDAKLTISNGKVTVFTSSEDGYKLDKNKTVQSILDVLNNRLKIAGMNTENQDSTQPVEISLSVDTTKPSVSNETVNNLGIKELIGTASTNFKGSPQNRISNIKVGTSLISGSLIKPGDTFSTIGALGDVSLAQGFLPELVIKEDSTQPEVGGGLCQVSTTLFRAALNSGLTIEERQNHKYRVSYYEPPVGMDATIYIPSPDLKFKNDTPGYILIQGSVSGTTLTFEFYGTSDGRKVEISDPVVYDITTPGDPVYKEDSSLAPGETKQKEKAHNGAKATFNYKVTRNGQVINKQTFNSTFVPWKAVYLVGPGGQQNTDQQSQDSSQQSQAPSCTPNWTYGQWSECSGGNQTRTADDGCGNTKTETQACTVTPPPTPTP